MSSLVETKDISTVLGLGIDVSPPIQAQLKVSAATATILLQQVLRTVFKQATYTERFHVSSCDKPFVGDKPYLYLKAGNVDLVGTPPVITRSYLYEELGTADPLDDTLYEIDAEKGLVILLAHNYWDIPGYRHRPMSDDYADNYYIEITYTAGYTTSAGCFQDVPEWLALAAGQLSGQVHRDSGLCCDDDDKISKDVMSKIERMIGSLILPHIRWYPYAIQPMT